MCLLLLLLLGSGSRFGPFGHQRSPNATLRRSDELIEVGGCNSIEEQTPLGHAGGKAGSSCALNESASTANES